MWRFPFTHACTIVDNFQVMSLLSPEVTSQKTPSFLLPFFSFDDLSKRKTLKIMLITNKRKGKSESRKQAKEKKEKEQNGQERTSYWNPPQKKGLSVPICVKHVHKQKKEGFASLPAVKNRDTPHEQTTQKSGQCAAVCECGAQVCLSALKARCAFIFL